MIGENTQSNSIQSHKHKHFLKYEMKYISWVKNISCEKWSYIKNQIIKKNFLQKKNEMKWFTRANEFNQ